MVLDEVEAIDLEEVTGATYDEDETSSIISSSPSADSESSETSFFLGISSFGAGSCGLFPLGFSISISPASDPSFMKTSMVAVLPTGTPTTQKVAPPAPGGLF